MTDKLGVDIDALKRTGPVVVTAPIPQSRLNSGLEGQRYQTRQEWHRRAARGEVPEGEQPPPGPSGWTLLVPAVIAGALTWLILGAIAQAIISGIGWMAGAHPGSYGWITGLAAGILTGLIVAARQERSWERDAAFLAERQRTLTDPRDCADIKAATHSALTVQENWPQMQPYLPDTDQAAYSRLHTAIWELAGALLERRKVTNALAEARSASFRLPPDTATAHDLTAQESHAEALQQHWDTRVRTRIAHLATLASQSRMFADEQDAITQARKVTQSMATALGTPTTGRQPYPEPAEELGNRITALRVAYIEFAEGLDSGN